MGMNTITLTTMAKNILDMNEDELIATLDNKMEEEWARITSEFKKQNNGEGPSEMVEKATKAGFALGWTGGADYSAGLIHDALKDLGIEELMAAAKNKSGS